MLIINGKSGTRKYYKNAILIFIKLNTMDFKHIVIVMSILGNYNYIIFLLCFYSYYKRLLF